MPRQKQFKIEEFNNKAPKVFGGAYLKNSHAKVKRPIATKRAMHLVMRSLKAKGQISFLKKEKKLKELFFKQAKQSGVKIYRFANTGNHFHLIVLPSSRVAFNKFIRSISGLVAREMLGIERGKTASTDKKNIEDASGNNPGQANGEIFEKPVVIKTAGADFWDKRPFTRIVEWGNEFKSLCQYIDKNILEAWGLVPYKNRNSRFKGTNRKYPAFASG